MMNKVKRFTMFEKIVIISVFLAPFNTLSLNVAYITISDLFLIFLMPFFLIKLFLNEGNIIQRSHALLKPIFFKLILGATLINFGFLLSLLFSQSGNFTETLTVLLQYSFVFIYIPIVLLFIRRDKYLDLIKVYIYGIVFVILIGLFLEIFNNSLYLDLIQRGVIIGRVRFGSFLGTNGLSKAIATCIPLVFILVESRKLGKGELIIIIVFFLIGIVKASSIGGTLASCLSFLLSFFTLRSSKIKRNLTIMIFLGALIMIFLVNQQRIDISTFSARVIESLLSGDLDDAGSFNVKIQLMKEAITIIANNPFIGLSSKGFVEISVFNQSVHNSYLLIWVEGGVFSFLGLLTIIISSMAFSLKYIKFKRTRSISILALVYLFIFALNLITGTHIYQRFRIVPLILLLYNLPFKDINIDKSQIEGWS